MFRRMKKFDRIDRQPEQKVCVQSVSNGLSAVDAEFIRRACGPSLHVPRGVRRK